MARKSKKFAHDINFTVVIRHLSKKTIYFNFL